MEPTAPSRSSVREKPTPPQKPFCASVRNCQQWEIDSYNRQVDEYNSELEDYQSSVEIYIRRLKQYLQDTQDYAICEAKSLQQ